MITAAVLDAMLAAGCTADQIVAAVKASLADAVTERDKRDDRKREAAKARQQRRRDKLKAVTVTRDITPAPARVEDKSQTTEIEPQLFVEEKRTSSPAKRDAAEFRSAFPDLDPERLEALIKHRKGKRAQNTAHAARLFRADVEACGLTLAAGVDMVISRNWITIKPEWLNRPARGSPAAPQGETVLQRRQRELAERITNEHGIGRERNVDPPAAGGLPAIQTDRRIR
jgi:hypothetical protein